MSLSGIVLAAVKDKEISERDRTLMMRVCGIEKCCCGAYFFESDMVEDEGGSGYKRTPCCGML